MRLAILFIVLSVIFLLSCNQDPVFDNPQPGELLVVEKGISKNFPLDTVTINYYRDAQQKWVRINVVSDREFTVQRDADGKILSLTTAIRRHDIYPGAIDSCIEKLFYHTNSNQVDYVISEWRYHNFKTQSDSLKYHYNNHGTVRSFEYHYFDKSTSSYIYIYKDSFEYDLVGNITKTVSVDHFLGFNDIVEFEYDYSKKSPFTFENELIPLMDGSEENSSPNLQKKRTHVISSSGLDLNDSLEYSFSQFNSASRPTVLSTAQYNPGNLTGTRRFFYYQ